MTISLAVTAAQSTLGAGTDTLRGFENLTGSLFDDMLTGSSASNILIGLDGDDLLNGGGGTDTLVGGSGNDLLNGGSNADTMIGGTGDDAYVVDARGDVVTEELGGGTDTVQSSIAYALGANVENLILTGTANINGSGNELDNVITGNTGNNLLAGLGGADLLDGGLGADRATYTASSAAVNVSLATGHGSGGEL